MTTFRTAADDPAEERPHATPPRGRKAPRRAAEPVVEQPASVDPVAARLQARLEALEANPAALEGRRPRTERPPTLPSAHTLPTQADAVADLNNQLDVLRDQLEVAFDDVDRRIAVAQTAADDAQARMAEVSAALEQLAAELPSLVAPGRADDLRQALNRLRDRLSPR